MIARLIYLKDKKSLIYADILINRILSLCAQFEWTISDLASNSGVSRTTLESFINHVSFNPGISTIHKIALGFGLTISDFLNFPELNEFSFDD